MTVCLPDSIRASLPYTLARAHQRQLQLFEAHTSELGVSGREYAIMLVLEGQPQLWQSEIANALNVDRTAITYLIDALEERGWAARGRDPADRRAHVVTLTDDGRATLSERIRPAAQAATQELLSPLNADEQAQLRGLLSRLCAGTP